MNRDVTDVARRFLDDERWRPGNADDAERLIEECQQLFRGAPGLASRRFRRLDAALFAASFDLGVTVFRFELKRKTVDNLLKEIRWLFEEHYVNQPRAVSCLQFWDNILGYKEVGESDPQSLSWFLAGAFKLLHLLSVHPVRKVRASALHGLNHFPDLEEARAALIQATLTERDAKLRAYAQKALDAFAQGRRLV